jgi:hypothetical protein
MSEFASSTVVAFLALALLGYLFNFTQKPPPKSLRFVPGPKGLPLVGNTLSLGAQPQKLFQKWAVEYGELFKIQMGWETWVFVNSPEAVKDISTSSQQSHRVGQECRLVPI